MNSFKEVTFKVYDSVYTERSPKDKINYKVRNRHMYVDTPINLPHLGPKFKWESISISDTEKKYRLSYVIDNDSVHICSADELDDIRYYNEKIDFRLTRTEKFETEQIKILKEERESLIATIKSGEDNVECLEALQKIDDIIQSIYDETPERQLLLNKNDSDRQKIESTPGSQTCHTSTDPIRLITEYHNIRMVFNWHPIMHSHKPLSKADQDRLDHYNLTMDALKHGIVDHVQVHLGISDFSYNMWQ